MTRRLLIQSLISFFATTGTAAAQDASLHTALSQRVAEYVAPYVRSGNFSGSILVARHGRILTNKGYGLADPEHGIPNGPGTRFHIASVSKTFTAVAILLLAEDGRLSLADPLARFVPDFPSGDRITIHNLLTHTSGIGDVNRSPAYSAASRQPHTTQSLLSLARSMSVAFKDSTSYSYSNTNYNILAYLIERTSGMSYGDFLASRLFRPAELTSTLHHADASSIIPDAAVGLIPGPSPLLTAKAPYLDWSVKTGNGSLVSTTADLFHWVQALTSGRLLAAALRQRMFTFVRWQHGIRLVHRSALRARRLLHEWQQSRFLIVHHDLTGG